MATAAQQPQGPPDSLPNMMTALQRADAADNAGDARQIAQMIQQHYPAHTSELLKGAPAGSAPLAPWKADASGSYPTQPNIAASLAPPPMNRTPDPSQPYVANPFPAMLQQFQNQEQQVAAPSPAASSAPSNVMPAAGSDGSNWLQRAGQDLTDFSRATLAAIPGGTQVAGFANALAQGNSPLAVLTGQPNLTTLVTGQTPYQQGLANVQGLEQQSAQRSPIASMAGDIFGNIGTMATGGVGLEAGLSKVAGGALGQTLARGAQSAQKAAGALGGSMTGRAVLGTGAGAASGAVDALAHGGSGSDVLTEAAMGSVLGPVVGAGADLMITKLAPAASRGWEILANKLTGLAKSGALDSATQSEAANAALRTMKVDPAELQQTLDQMKAANGGNPPPLAAVLQRYGQAKLAQIARKTPELGNALPKSADDWAAQGPTQVPALIKDAVSGVSHDASPTGYAGPQDNGALTVARDANTKAAIDPIRGVAMPISADDAEVFQDPAVQATMSGLGEKALRGRVNDAIDAATTEAPQPGPPTLAQRIQQAVVDHQAGAQAMGPGVDDRAFLADIRARVGAPPQAFDQAVMQLHADPDSGFTLGPSMNPRADFFASGKGAARKGAGVDVGGQRMVVGRQDPAAFARQMAPPPEPSGRLSIDDLDVIRRELGRRTESTDPVIAQGARGAYKAVSEIARRNDEYDAALRQHAQQSAYAQGHAHAMAGVRLGANEDSASALAKPDTAGAYAQGHASGTVTRLADQAGRSEADAQSVLQQLAQDNALRQQLTQAYGPDIAAKLANTGEQLSRATAAMNHVAPRSPVAGQDPHHVAPALARAALSEGVGSHVGLAHNLFHALTAFFGPRGLSPAAGQKLASMLGDPGQAQAAIGILKRQGATNQQIARISAYASAIEGGNLARQGQAVVGY